MLVIVPGRMRCAVDGDDAGVKAVEKLLLPKATVGAVGIAGTGMMPVDVGVLPSKVFNRATGLEPREAAP